MSLEEQKSTGFNAEASGQLKPIRKDSVFAKNPDGSNTFVHIETGDIHTRRESADGFDVFEPVRI